MLNHIVIMGRLTRDPELRYTQSQTPVASFTVAVDRDFGGRDGGERQTDFIDCSAWRSTAEFVNKYFRKGSPANGRTATATTAPAGRSTSTTFTSAKAAATAATETMRHPAPTLTTRIGAADTTAAGAAAMRLPARSIPRPLPSPS